MPRRERDTGDQWHSLPPASRTALQGTSGRAIRGCHAPPGSRASYPGRQRFSGPHCDFRYRLSKRSENKGTGPPWGGCPGDCLSLEAWRTQLGVSVPGSLVKRGGKSAVGFKWPPLATEVLRLYGLTWACEGFPESLRVVTEEGKSVGSFWKSQLPASAPLPPWEEPSLGHRLHSAIQGLTQPPVRNLKSEPGGCWLAWYI